MDITLQCSVHDLGVRVYGLGFKVKGFRVQSLGLSHKPERLKILPASWGALSLRELRFGVYGFGCSICSKPPNLFFNPRVFGRVELMKL